MKRKLVISMSIIIVLGCLSYYLLADLYTYDTSQIHKGISIAHPLGTDYMGRDNMMILVVASGISLGIAIISALLSVFLSFVIGCVSAMYGGIVDFLCMRTAEVIHCLPLLPLLLIASFIVKDNIPISLFLIICMALLSWSEGAKLIRSEVLTLKKQEFIIATQVLGASTLYIVYKHILRHCHALLKNNFIVVIARVLLLESSISFLGFGIEAGIPSLGKLINLARDSEIFIQYPLDYMPAAFICFVFVFFIRKMMKDI